MRRYMWIVVGLVVLLAHAPLCAQDVQCDSVATSDRLGVMPDELRISVLTCSPGQKLYSLYGHTAIRCTDPASGEDAVFNYGVFSFDQPHFVWRFVLGKCDYMVEAVRFNAFLRAYRQRGSRVTEQVLALSPEEAEAVLGYLLNNLKPQNNTYRYNFLYNNCTTKVRDVIEQIVQGRISYLTRKPAQTTREILRHYTQGHPWASEGDDLLLGSAVDTVASDRAAMFAPEYMMEYLDGASVHAQDGSVRPLVAETHVLTPGREVAAEPEFPLSPKQVGWGMLVLCIVIVLAERLAGRVCTLWSVMLLLVQGLVGALLLFMGLFSEHPDVDANWLVWAFNPLALLGVGIVLWSRGRVEARWWIAYFCFLTSFLLFYPLIPQNFGNIVVPLTMSLLTRPVGFYICCRRERESE